MLEPSSLMAECEVPSDAVVAIDGPSGSGKSTTARALAERFGLMYVDSGAMYRALTWAALDAGIAPGDAGSLAALLSGSELRLRTTRRETDVFWNGRDISTVIRTPAVEAAVSEVSAHHAVREMMVERQREFGRTRGVVMEGRDIGSVVFPLATVKIYLDASHEARVERRWLQHRRRGVEIERADVAREIAARDYYDSTRAESPLTVAADALVIDNSELTFSEQIEATSEAVRRVIAEQRPAPRGRDELPPAYRLTYNLFRPVARFCGMKVLGWEHIWQREGVIFSPNHVSNWDPPILAAILDGRAPIHSVAKEELFRHPLMGRIYRWMDCIPIKRTINDAAAFEVASEKLRAGANVLFFPEGMRRPPAEPGPVRTGIGRLMQASGAAALPIHLRGTRDVTLGGSRRSPLEVRIAPPVRLRALSVLLRDHDAPAISRRVAHLFERIYAELLARSVAETPLSEWELADTERQRVVCARKTSRLLELRHAEKARRNGRKPV